jgi:F420H(2)-dependent quinone reductase
VSLFSYALRVHEKLYKATDGRIGHRLLGVPTLLLRTTGRRSGVTRTNGLVYAADGADQPPAWLLNLEANPEVEIQIGREREKGSSRVAGASDPDYGAAMPRPLPALSLELEPLLASAPSLGAASGLGGAVSLPATSRVPPRAFPRSELDHETLAEVGTREQWAKDQRRGGQIQKAVA